MLLVSDLERAQNKEKNKCNTKIIQCTVIEQNTLTRNQQVISKAQR